MAARRGVFRALESLAKFSQCQIRRTGPGMASAGLELGWGYRSGLLGMSIAAVGTAAAYTSSSLTENRSGRLMAYSISAADALPGAPSVFLPKDALRPITLYQYEVCPFCCKVRAFLDYHKIPYTVVEVNPLSKDQLKWSDYKKVPVVKFGDEQVNDSNAIISRLSDELENWSKENKATKKGWFGNSGNSSVSAADGSEAEEKWRKWVDERFVRLVTANIYRNWGESWQTFDYITEHGNFGAVSRHSTRVFGAATMWMIGKRMPKKYQIEGDLREALYSATNEWVSEIGDKDFLGGVKPNLGDLAVFGVMRAIIGTDTFKDVLENTKILPWYTRMADAVGDTSRVATEKS